MKKWKIYGISILLAEIVGALAGFLTREGMKSYVASVVKPAFSPPEWLFPVVWTFLFALMGIGAARIWMAEPSPERSQSLNLYVAQLIVNFFWPLFFFNMAAYGLSLVWLLLLWVLVLAMILSFRKVDPFAAWLQIPYLIWLTFAAYLNWGVWKLNR